MEAKQDQSRARHDHARFCDLVRDDATDLLARHPSIAKDDWVCRCYLSFEFFFNEFPTIAARDVLLRSLADDRQKIERDAQWVQSFDPGLTAGFREAIARRAEAEGN